MAIGTTRKDPNATRKYTVSWERWLENLSDEGQTIQESTWIVPEGVEKLDDSHTEDKTIIWLKGGTPGARYNIVNRITTDDGQIEDATLELIIKQN